MQKKRELKFNPDTMTVKDVKEAAESFRRLLKLYNENDDISFVHAYLHDASKMWKVE